MKLGNKTVLQNVHIGLSLDVGILIKFDSNKPTTDVGTTARVRCKRVENVPFEILIDEMEVPDVLPTSITTPKDILRYMFKKEDFTARMINTDSYLALMAHSTNKDDQDLLREMCELLKEMADLVEITIGQGKIRGKEEEYPENRDTCIMLCKPTWNQSTKEYTNKYYSELSVCVTETKITSYEFSVKNLEYQYPEKGNDVNP